MVGVRRRGIFQQRGHVEAEHAVGQVQPVFRIVEQPGVLAVLDPRAQPVGQIAGLRTAGAGQQFPEMAQPAQRRIVGVGRIDRRCDGRDFFRPVRLQQHAQPVAQKGAIGWRVGQRQRVETGRFARADAVIASADPAHEQFRAAILVEQDGARR